MASPRRTAAIPWGNSPVLLEAIDRYERGLLAPSLCRWLQDLLEIERSTELPLRRRSC